MSTFGEDGFAMLIDEGGMTYFVTTVSFCKTHLPLGNMEATSDGMLAMPGVAEKGYFDLRVSVSTSGGHSSVPPEHTVSS